MRFVSTRGESSPAGFTEALSAGLADDGGLYVPERFPSYDLERFRTAGSFPEMAALFIEPFLRGDALESQVGEICTRAFDFPLPLTDLKDRTALLELFHGPTAAFKDFGARFLAECYERIASGADRGTTTVLVATSGDTGGAVAAAFHRRPGVRVAVLYPVDGVSPRQERHLTCWDDNVQSFAVGGSFDDCQRIVKQAFADSELCSRMRLTSANSINIGRLLPQAAYYAVASVLYERRHGIAPGFVIPAGNMGNAIGAFWARRMGFPIRRILLAANANRAVPDWFDNAEWRPRPPLTTLANAMDVGNPSNMERLFHLYPERESLLADTASRSVDDATIRQVIAAGPESWGQVWCPHTATAVHLREQTNTPDWVIVATAHAAKFETIVEPLIGREVEVPSALAELLERPTQVTRIEPRLEELIRQLDRGGQAL